MVLWLPDSIHAHNNTILEMMSQERHETVKLLHVMPRWIDVGDGNITRLFINPHIIQRQQIIADLLFYYTTTAADHAFGTPATLRSYARTGAFTGIGCDISVEYPCEDAGYERIQEGDEDERRFFPLM